MPAVCGLYQWAYTGAERPASSGLLATVRELFHEGPLADADCPSLVHVDAAGSVSGFLGVQSRPFTFSGQRLRAAVTHQLIVDRRKQGTVAAAIQLLGTLLSGPQDLTFTDGAADVVEPMWKRHGGIGIAHYSIEWTLPLRRAGLLLARLRRSRRRAALARLLGPAVFVDRLIGGARPAVPSVGQVQDASPEEYVDCLDLPGREALRPVHDLATWSGQAKHIATTSRLGALRLRLVREGTRLLGGFASLVRTRQLMSVLHVGVQSVTTTGPVLDHLVHDAWQQGAVAITGALDGKLRQPLAARGASFSFGGYGFLAHSRRPEIIAALQRGDSTLSRLDGEWWTRLGIDNSLDW